MTINRIGILLLFLSVCCLDPGFAQNTTAQRLSHEENIRRLEGAEHELFEMILGEYDAHLEGYPDDVKTYIEKCKFVETAFYDDESGYNPKEQAFDQCLAVLEERFPDDPDVLYYRSSFLYGDTALVFLHDLLKRQEEQPDRWADALLWQVHRDLAESYSYNDEPTQALHHADQATQLNDTLDLSLLMATDYVALSRKEEAKRILKEKLDSWAAPWTLNQKGKLLLDLEEAEAAIEAFNRVSADTSAWVDKVAVGNALEQVGKYDEARRFFLEAEHTDWNPLEARLALFKHDLAYQSADSAWATYNRLRDLGYENDPFARHRIALSLNHPLTPWRFRDLLGILNISICLLVLVCLPYLWILPIYFYGVRLRKKKPVNDAFFYRWGLKHFWSISALYLIYSVLALVLFEYTEVVSWFSDSFIEVAPASEAALANEILFFFLAMALSTLFFIRFRDGKMLWGTAWSIKKVLGVGFLVAYGLRLFLRVLLLVVQSDTGVAGGIPIATLPEEVGFLLGKEDMVALVRQYGGFIAFLFIVIVVPIYEEVLFRGVLLTSCERYIGFRGANVVQAVFFGLIHDNLSLFLFYFVTALVLGYLRKRSSGLGAGIVVHSFNNMFATIGLLLL